MRAGAPVVTFPRVGIVGLGLIGGSIAAAIRGRLPGVEITAIDIPPTIAAARARGLIDHAAATPADLHHHDLIVVATPIAAALAMLDGGALSAARGVVTDVGSTKREVLAAALRAGVPRFVGGHPMAGREHSGLEHADADLFVDHPWLLVSGDPDSPDVGAVSRFVADLGAAPALIEAAAHDRAAAYLSHMPQLLAIALMRAASAALAGDEVQWAGRAFREMTRVAASEFPMWRDILATNADNIAAALRDVVSALPAAGSLANVQSMEEAFGRANRARAALDRPRV